MVFYLFLKNGGYTLARKVGGFATCPHEVVNEKTKAHVALERIETFFSNRPGYQLCIFYVFIFLLLRYVEVQILNRKQFNPINRITVEETS